MLANQPDAFWGGWDANNATHGGPTFRVTTPSAVTALRFWRDDAGSATPGTIGLFRVSDQALVGSQSPVLDDFNAGWQATPLSQPINIQDGVDYFAAAYWPNGGGHGISGNGATLNALPSGFVLTTDNRREVAGAPFKYPTNSIPDYIFAVDAFVEFGPPPYPSYAGLNSGDIYNELYKWLSTSGSSFAGSALDLILQNTAGNSSKIDTLLSRLTADVANKLTVFLDDYGVNARGFFDAITAKVDNVSLAQADLLERIGDYTGVSLFQYAADTIRWLNGGSAQQYRDPVTYYDPVDSIAFANNLEWPVQADLYTVDLDTFEPGGTSEPFGTQTRYGYLGKWSPLDVTYTAEWHYFNTPHARLENVGHTLPGLALILYRPGGGTVTAWKLKEA